MCGVTFVQFTETKTSQRPNLEGRKMRTKQVQLKCFRRGFFIEITF